MTFTLAPISVKKADGTSTPMIAYSDGTNNAFANVLLDATGAIISPATSGLQTTANSALATIVTNTTALSTAALQSTANTSLAAIATNTSGASTSAKQDTGNTSLAAIATNTSGVATSAKQDTGNTSLAAIATNTAGVATASKQDTGNAALASIATSVATIATNTGTEATAAKQDTGNTALDAIKVAVEAGATAANQSASNTKLDTLIANTGVGSVFLTNTPTVAATTHALDDVVGGKISLAGAARVSGGGGIIQSVMVNVQDAVTAIYDVIFFGTNPTNSTFTDDGTINLVAADQPFVLGVVKCTDIISMGTRKLVQATGIALPFKLSTGTTLYAVIVARGSAAYTTANGVTLNVGLLQD